MNDQLSKIWGCTGDFIWDGSNIRWTGDIVLSGIGPSMYGLTQGRVNIPMMAVGTKIPIKPNKWGGSIGSVTVTTVTGGIPLKPGDTLYIGVPPGTGDTFNNGLTNWTQSKWLFFVVDSETHKDPYFNYRLPEWAFPIARRGIAGEKNQVRITAPHLTLVDNSQYRVDAQSGSFSGTQNTEAVIHTLPTMAYRAGTAYRVRFKTGYTTASTTSPLLLRLRKGALGGADWGEFFRAPASSTAGNQMGFYGESYLVNNTAADINTVVVATGNSTGAAWTMFANSVSKRYVEIEPCGPASKYLAHGVLIT